jgi:hypothetical protein
MAGSFDVNVVSVDLGQYIGDNTRPLIYIPNQGGGITIQSAKLIGSGAGTAIGGKLVTLTDAGTPLVAGTIGTFAATAAGTAIFAVKVPHNVTLSTRYVAGGQWLGVVQVSGTTPANTILSLSYVMGKKP